jgi:hypothetical protein
VWWLPGQASCIQTPLGLWQRVGSSGRGGGGGSSSVTLLHSCCPKAWPPTAADTTCRLLLHKEESPSPGCPPVQLLLSCKTEPCTWLLVCSGAGDTGCLGPSRQAALAARLACCGPQTERMSTIQICLLHSRLPGLLLPMVPPHNHTGVHMAASRCSLRPVAAPEIWYCCQGGCLPVPKAELLQTPQQ